MDVQIRPAASTDRDAIHALHLSAFPESENQLVAKLATDMLKETTTPATMNLVAETGGEVVGHSAVELDGRVEAAGPHRAVQHIPERDTFVSELLAPRRIVTLDAENFAHDAPEGILRMGIVLLLVDRTLARQAA